MKKQEQQILATDELKLHWRTWAPDYEIVATVCLVHGLGEHSGRYDHVAQAFVEQGIAFHAFDLRGHGKSEGKRGHTPSLKQWLDDIHLLMDRADTTRPRFLYGHSLGGSIALNYGLHSHTPPAGIIATGPALKRSFQVPAIKILLGKGMAKLWPTFSQHSGLDPEAISRDKTVVQAYIDDPLVHDWASARLFIEATKAGEQALTQATEFELPLLLVCGQKDRLVDVTACEAFFGSISSEDKTLRILPGLYHEVHNEPEKADVISEMLRWVLDRK